MYLKDLNDSEKDNAILDSKNRVLCPVCKKNQAIITEYGMIRTCQNCKREEVSIMVSIDEPGGRKTY
jgi:uncharacterized CHY-type Zn-finger protein